MRNRAIIRSLTDSVNTPAIFIPQHGQFSALPVAPRRLPRTFRRCPGSMSRCPGFFRLSPDFQTLAPVLKAVALIYGTPRLFCNMLPVSYLRKTDNLTTLHQCMGQARKTAKLAFPGQTVKLHQEFQIGIHDSHELNAVLSRADVILASVQTTANLPAMKLKGWTDAE